MTTIEQVISRIVRGNPGDFERGTLRNILVLNTPSDNGKTWEGGERGSLVVGLRGDSVQGNCWFQHSGESFPPGTEFFGNYIKHDGGGFARSLDAEPVCTTQTTYAPVGRPVMIADPGVHQWKILRCVAKTLSGDIVVVNESGNVRIAVSTWLEVTGEGLVDTVLTDPGEAEVVEAAEGGRSASEVALALEVETTRRVAAERALADLWEALEGKARELNWCSDYDLFAEENDGPVRQRTIEVTVDLTSVMDVNVADGTFTGLFNTKSNDHSMDFREEVTMVHRVEVKITGQGDADDLVENGLHDALTEAGWVYSECEVIETYEV